MTRASLLRSATVFVALAATAGSVGCKKKTPEPDPVPVAPAASPLQIVRMDPSSADENVAVSAVIYGSGFEQGATVVLGTENLSKARIEDSSTIRVALPAMPVGSYDLTVTNPDGGSATLRRAFMVNQKKVGDCAFVRVNFDFDVSSLRSDATSVLQGKVSCYQSSNAKIKIEGHADERGTTDYNLALGQRRADSVKRFLSSNGVADGRLSTVSYGEERPVEKGSNESAWAANRRADIYAAE